MYGTGISTSKTNFNVIKIPPTTVATERPKTRGKQVYHPPDKTKTSNAKIPLSESTRSEPIRFNNSPGQRRRADQNKIKDNPKITNVWFSDKQGSQSIPFQTLPLLKQRLGHLLDDKFHTDVVFLVGPNEDKVEAHRLILSSASPVFEQLLYIAKPLILDDKMLLYEREFPISIFEVFIKALYSGEVPICLTLAFALDTFYVAKKYDVKFLQKLLLEHVSQVVTTVNVFEALAVSTRMIELTPMIPLCWRIIEEQTEGVLEQNLETMNTHTFARILEREQLNLEEIELFQYLVKWAVIRCKRRGLKTTGKMKRQMVEPLLKYIRFPAMDSTTIHELVVPTRILDSKEVTSILTHVHGMDHKMTVPYKTAPRRKPNKMKHIFSGCYSSPRLIHGKKKDSISSSSRTQIFSSDSEDNYKPVPLCNKIKTSEKTISTAPTPDLVTPRTVRNKISPTKTSKRPIRSQR